MNILPVSITSELVSGFLSYSTSIYNRALPDVVDGLKVAQRRVILGINDLRLRSDSGYCKVSRLEGHVLGRYHPQGGCAGTVINMGQQSGMRYVLTDIHGNAGGSIQSGSAVGQMVSEDPPAAARYLEVRATPLCEQLFLMQLDHGIGDWRDNYDGTCKEPVRFVPVLPSLLLTGAQGIASGYACSHIPYSFRDVISATIAWIKNKNLSDLQFFSKFTSPPEAPQGGRVVKDNQIKEVLKSGKGSVTVYGEWETPNDIRWGKRSTRPGIIITRLANGSSEKFVERVRYLADQEKISGLIDAADHSSRDGIHIVLVAKTVPERDAILRTLIRDSGLKHIYNVNSVAVGLDGKPLLIGAKESVSVWYGERVKYLSAVHKKEVDKMSTEQERLKAVVQILKELDKFLKIIRTAKDKPFAVAKVSKTWKLTEEVAKHVVSIPVSTLIATESSKVSQELESLSSEIERLSLLCVPGPELDSFICEQITSLRSLATPARASWMTEEISEAPKPVKILTERDRIVSEGKEIGLTSRTVNKWIADNIGTGKLNEKWESFKSEHVHRNQMTTRSGKLERKEKLQELKDYAQSKGMPKRGQYAWNAFISTCKNGRIEEIRGKLDKWLENLPYADTDQDRVDSRTDSKSGKRGAKTPERKRVKRTSGAKPSSSKRKSGTGNAQARSPRRSSRRSSPRS